MNKLALLAFALLQLFRLHAQDSAWKKISIDENVSVSLPGIKSQTDTTIVKEGKKYQFRFLNAVGRFSVLNVLSTPNETGINVNNAEALNQALEALVKGSINSLSRQGYRCSVADTIIDKIPGKKVTCSSENLAGFDNYMFLVNDKMYAFQGIIDKTDSAREGMAELNRLLKSIRFNHAAVKEQKFATKAEALGYQVGKLLFPLLIIGVVLFFVLRKK